MDEASFEHFLRRGGRSPKATARCIRYVHEFEEYLQSHRGSTKLKDAGADDLEQFVAWVEREPKASANTHLWALRYLFEYTSNEAMRALASAMRGQRVTRTPFALHKFRGVDPEYVDRLAAQGITNVEQMREAGRTPDGRQALAEKTGVPPEAVLQFAKLADLARIPGLKEIRARLYYDAGVDTVEKLAAWDPSELRDMLIDFVERTGFDGIAPLPKEAASAVSTAMSLPKVVEY
jgi:predicted flap endonuclease-1-like 5' DNA nuclease